MKSTEKKINNCNDNLCNQDGQVKDNINHLENDLSDLGVYRLYDEKIYNSEKKKYYEDKKKEIIDKYSSRKQELLDRIYKKHHQNDINDDNLVDTALEDSKDELDDNSLEDLKDNYLGSDNDDNLDDTSIDDEFSDTDDADDLDDSFTDDDADDLDDSFTDDDDEEDLDDDDEDETDSGKAKYLDDKLDFVIDSVLERVWAMSDLFDDIERNLPSRLKKINSHNQEVIRKIINDINDLKNYGYKEDEYFIRSVN